MPDATPNVPAADGLWATKDNKLHGSVASTTDHQAVEIVSCVLQGGNRQYRKGRPQEVKNRIPSPMPRWPAIGHIKPNIPRQSSTKCRGIDAGSEGNQRTTNAFICRWPATISKCGNT